MKQQERRSKAAVGEIQKKGRKRNLLDGACGLIFLLADDDDENFEFLSMTWPLSLNEVLLLLNRACRCFCRTRE